MKRDCHNQHTTKILPTRGRCAYWRCFFRLRYDTTAQISNLRADLVESPNQRAKFQKFEHGMKSKRNLSFSGKNSLNMQCARPFGPKLDYLIFVFFLCFPYFFCYVFLSFVIYLYLCSSLFIFSQL